MNGENGGFSIGKSEILFLMGEVHFFVVTSVVQLSTFRLIVLYQLYIYVLQGWIYLFLISFLHQLVTHSFFLFLFASYE